MTEEETISSIQRRLIIHIATIIPPGHTLGMVICLLEGDLVSMTWAKMMADLAVAMGGHIPEELIFAQIKLRQKPPLTSRWPQILSYVLWSRNWR